MTAGELFELLSADGAKLLCDTLEGLENGTLHPQKQDGAAATMAPMLDKAMCPLDFQKSAKALHDQVRGLQPWPTATCRLGDTVLKIHKTRVGGHTTEDAGIIVSLSPLSVACGDGGVLEILELQYPGSRRMAAADSCAVIRFAAATACNEVSDYVLLFAVGRAGAARRHDRTDPREIHLSAVQPL